MSAQRAIAPLTSSACMFFRLPSSASTVASFQPCQHSLRRFSSIHPCRISNKRKIQTSSAYQPYSLPSDLPPPPRNARIPESSIAGGIPQMNDTRPPQNSQQQVPSIIVTEREAQKSKPITQAGSTATTVSTQTKPKPRPKLRALKAAMKLTPRAVEQLRAMLDQPEPKIIKVGVKNKGCSGLAYHLEYVEKPGVFDEMVEQDGVKVLIDSKALFSIIGTEMDWIEDKLNQRFVFTNPNIKEQCGCGESFMV